MRAARFNKRGELVSGKVVRLVNRERKSLKHKTDVEILNYCNYIVSMKTQVIKIGNSKGIRIPKSILEHSGLGKEVDIEVGEDELITRPVNTPRKGWSEAFRLMSEQGNDTTLDVDDMSIKNSWNEEEWEW